MSQNIIMDFIEFKGLNRIVLFMPLKLKIIGLLFT